MDRIHVLYPEKIGVISKNIYGYFVEQISTLVEGGVWVGENSSIPNIRGIRKELVEKLRAVKAPVFRWPGGCTAEVYDWRDGIGPRKSRPVTLAVAYRADGKVQANDFGTHEFIEFCRLCGADPYICLNVAGSPPLESFKWMEYCNMPRGMTTLAKRREKNGSPEPLNIGFWGLGNENGNHGGMMTPEEYCAAYSRVVSISWSILENRETFASGPIWNNIDWSRRFFTSYNSRAVGWEGKKLDGYSIHWYSGSDSHDDTFTQEEWYQKLGNAVRTQRIIDDHRAILQEFDPDRHVGLIFDEWGSWTSANRVPSFDRPLYLQTGTMREALVAAITLNIFNNNCDIVKMANITALINYIHALFLSEGEKLIVTPTYFVFDMMKEHQNAECIRTVCASEIHNGIQQVMASASVKDGKTLLTLVNTSYTESKTMIIELHNSTFSGKAEMVTLSADDPHAHNTFDRPDAVASSSTVVDAEGDELRLTMPAASIVCLRF
jgi:alpha-L-arabinofuranosidase